jgi:hypothetical protein
MLEEAGEDGLALEDVEAAIMGEEDARIDLIADVEAGQAVTQGRLDEMDAQGIETAQWVSMRDEVVRPNHRTYDAAGPMPIGFNYAKLVGEGYLLRWPYDDECEEPGEICNCRCFHAPAGEFEGTEAELRELLGDTGEPDAEAEAAGYTPTTKDFREEEHPRDAAGKFTDAGGGGSGGGSVGAGERGAGGVRGGRWVPPDFWGDDDEEETPGVTPSHPLSGPDYSLRVRSSKVSPEELDKAVARTFGEKGVVLTHELAGVCKTVIDEVTEAVNPEKPYLDVRVAVISNAVTIEATGSGARIQRTFELQYMRDGSTKLVAHHDLMRLPKDAQSGHIATRMLAASIESYTKAGVDSVEVTANIDGGGYAWAALGFQAVYPDHFAANMKEQMSDAAEDRLSDLRAFYEEHATVRQEARRDELYEGMLRAGKDAPAWLASQPEGKAVLVNSTWDGVLHLKTPSGKEVASRIIDKAKKHPKGKKG